ncbi:CPBP family intramembrane metalloprotease [Microbacterium sp. NEAU-LLC]|uniref:CPBP family intramembrane metalloprotease n=1 Tax=Microbacterium helvum TaxID=2773713 RepID=A0ABR8NQZ1_9MICO|nr:CPBP family intramembrane glutamic endopeptidase [Microbacterium helvum]MBD3942388.1 CPBP family intramembrane metalloprotease [Microbacterium helvum]
MTAEPDSRTGVDDAVSAEPAATAAPSPAPDTAVRWPAVIAFVLLACGLAWAVALPLWLGEGLRSPFAGLVLPAMMLTPAAAALVVVFAFRVPARGRARFLGLWPLRPAGRFVLFLALALVVPVLVVVATALLAGALGLVRLDLVGFSGYAAQLAASVPAGSALPPVALLVALQFVALPMGAVVNSVLALGEELGWRGWLQTALLPLGTWPALLLTGVVWGLWHAPVILLGYNFARPDVVGVLLMVGGCVAWGVLFGWLRLRSASLWPAVLAHGSLNAVGGIVFVLVAAGTTPDLGLVGPLGVASWAVLAVVVGVIVLIRQFRPGALAAPRTPAVTPTEGEPR